MGGLGSIPWTSIDRWADRNGVTQTEFQDLHRFVRLLDGVWLDDQAKRQKAAAEAEAAKKKGGRHGR